MNEKILVRCYSCKIWSKKDKKCTFLYDKKRNPNKRRNCVYYKGIKIFKDFSEVTK